MCVLCVGEHLGVVVVVLSSQPEWVDTHSKLQWGKGGAWLAMADAPPIVLCIKELVKGVVVTLALSTLPIARSA